MITHIFDSPLYRDLAKMLKPTERLPFDIKCRNNSVLE